MSQTTRKYVLDTPILFERPDDKKRSPAISDARQVERHLSRAVHRTIRAADKGMTRYRKAQKRSAAKGDNDVMVDFIPNLLRGSAATMQELSIVPLDLLRAANTPRMRKMTRRTVRNLARAADDMLDS